MAANGTFFTQAKAVSGGVLKEMHGLVCDVTYRLWFNTYKTKPTNTKCIKKKCIILSNTIWKDLKIDIANHVAYATYATT